MIYIDKLDLKTSQKQQHCSHQLQRHSSSDHSGHLPFVNRYLMHCSMGTFLFIVSFSHSNFKVIDVLVLGSFLIDHLNLFNKSGFVHFVYSKQYIHFCKFLRACLSVSFDLNYFQYFSTEFLRSGRTEGRVVNLNLAFFILF